jgi:hypothetical protein
MPQLNKLETLSDRLKYALEIVGMKQVELARLIEVKPQVINFLCENATKSSRFTFEIATVLKLNPKWLAQGEGVVFLEDDPRHRIFEEYRIVSIVNNAQLIQIIKTKELPSLKETEIAPVKNQDNNILGLRVFDASMAPLFPINSLIFFRWDMSYVPQEKDYVVFFEPYYNSIMIRQILVQEKKKVLSAINQEWFKAIELHESIRLVGKVVEASIMFGGENEII